MVSIVRAGLTAEERVGPFFLEMIRAGTPTATEYAGTIQKIVPQNVILLVEKTKRLKMELCVRRYYWSICVWSLHSKAFTVFEHHGAGSNIRTIAYFNGS